MTEEFSYSHDTFPWHDDCYTWPKVAVITERKGDELTAAELNVHCICDVKHRQFWCVGFIGVERQMQINHVVWLAEKMGAEVTMIKGLGFTDEIINGLMAIMEEPEPDERPGQSVALVPVDWPNKIQRRVLRKLQDATTPGKPFHEKELANRLHMPVEEVRHHLQVLADIGLVDEA